MKRAYVVYVMVAMLVLLSLSCAALAQLPLSQVLKAREPGSEASVVVVVPTPTTNPKAEKTCWLRFYVCSIDKLNEWAGWPQAYYVSISADSKNFSLAGQSALVIGIAEGSTPEGRIKDFVRDAILSDLKAKGWNLPTGEMPDFIFRYPRRFTGAGEEG
ncbi:hypothetical protein A2716_01595 [candidate division WWE3 bacterium RIFCSPHIGHO2_01_FULL_40_23]|uniref:TonB C-terminal domain-containing protein n=1 Tax=candidate division WWE3 bacterium RIFCSPLOWO2_01_FULL_41_18 TaxID=1802625 RepID=A0A1F4VFI1_UNCKA|nr:MAG: hypothetical protein A2716_01595 [candidate division WWE3 bacterium RIFCSPHIGHO2_01_FULL_40_23]OGC55688.1 MAG: hypothetical protein A3A78_01445 [candidate division WWE3 bacterium RIFCSPLOWO2_01_FULL_41_18]